MKALLRHGEAGVVLVIFWCVLWILLLREVPSQKSSFTASLVALNTVSVVAAPFSAGIAAALVIRRHRTSALNTVVSWPRAAALRLVLRELVAVLVVTLLGTVAMSAAALAVVWLNGSVPSLSPLLGLVCTWSVVAAHMALGAASGAWLPTYFTVAITVFGTYFGAWILATAGPSINVFDFVGNAATATAGRVLATTGVATVVAGSIGVTVASLSLLWWSLAGNAVRETFHHVVTGPLSAVGLILTTATLFVVGSGRVDAWTALPPSSWTCRSVGADHAMGCVPSDLGSEISGPWFDFIDRLDRGLRGSAFSPKTRVLYAPFDAPPLVADEQLRISVEAALDNRPEKWTAETMISLDYLVHGDAEAAIVSDGCMTTRNAVEGIVRQIAEGDEVPSRSLQGPWARWTSCG